MPAACRHAPVAMPGTHRHTLVAMPAVRCHFRHPYQQAHRLALRASTRAQRAAVVKRSAILDSASGIEASGTGRLGKGAGVSEKLGCNLGCRLPTPSASDRLCADASRLSCRRRRGGGGAASVGDVATLVVVSAGIAFGHRLPGIELSLSVWKAPDLKEKTRHRNPCTSRATIRQAGDTARPSWRHAGAHRACRSSRR